jgi:protein-S-isoprenylcysteine O-methyltransferase Ste14
LPTLAYYRLSKREESEMITLFVDEYRRYRELTPMFIPKAGRLIPT